MPLQNRVTPTGDIVAVPARGMFMGNRGILHDDKRQLGPGRWKHKAWIICLLSFRGRRRVPLTPHRYTELFFLDEAVAIAAGHRPCFECRRQDSYAWQSAWRDGNGLADLPRAPAMDDVLHAERAVRGGRRQNTWTAPADALADGVFVLLDAALPSKLDQITVTQEFLEMTFEETGDQVFTDRAAGLQQDKATEVARLRGQQEAQELDRDLGRDRGLDDEMEF